MGMDSGHDVRPRREDRRMDKTFEIKGAVLAAYRLTVQVKFDNVFGGDQLRRERAGDQKSAGIAGVADADMPVGVDDLLPGENAVGDDEFMDHRVDIAHRVD